MLSVLRMGMTHTPYPLLKYKEFTPETHKKFEMRTFEQLRADQERYRESGCPKSKVKEYHNCEFESLFKGAGPIILKTSCMPLHISLRIGLKV